jgi:hypothetical protein
LTIERIEISGLRFFSEWWDSAMPSKDGNWKPIEQRWPIEWRVSQHGLTNLTTLSTEVESSF